MGVRKHGRHGVLQRKQKPGSGGKGKAKIMCPQRLIGSVDKALIVLQRLGEAGMEGRPLKQLAEELGLNKASLHHTLSALRNRGFVEHDNRGNYRLGNAALALSESYMHDNGLPRIHGALKALSASTGEICHLGVLVGEDILYTHKVTPQNSINTWSTVGFRNPALITALGRAILSQKYVDFESFAREFQSPVARRTAYTKNSLKDIWQELLHARMRGFSREVDEYAVGTSCVAVAVLRKQKVIAAISITGPTQRFGDSFQLPLISALHNCITPHLPAGVTLQMPLFGDARHARMSLARSRSAG
jgi:DNA-binding IclR family transcriptional regulator